MGKILSHSEPKQIGNERAHQRTLRPTALGGVVQDLVIVYVPDEGESRNLREPVAAGQVQILAQSASLSHIGVFCFVIPERKSHAA